MPVDGPAWDPKPSESEIEFILETARGYGNFLRNSLPPFWYTTRTEVALGALKRLAQT